MALADHLRFVLNGEAVSVAGVPPATTLLKWLRYQRRLMGTKEGCAEGDCGACTVALRVPRADGRVETRAVNACITLLPMVHGREVVTVEGIAGAGGALHPVQRAMVDAHASQCGFCTPGLEPEGRPRGPAARRRADHRPCPPPVASHGCSTCRGS